MKKILVVEDNEASRDMLTRHLDRMGYVVFSAADGPMGIETAIVEMPDVILMDITLGQMNGWEATTILLTDERTKNIPVIALTSHSEESERRKAKEVGCVDFSAKPISLGDLIHKIERHT